MPPLPPCVGSGMPTTGPLRSSGVTRLPGYYGPIRHPLASAPFPGGAGYGSGRREVYVRRARHEAPTLVYTHHRGIDVLLGNDHGHMLVNDSFATKANKVVLAEIGSGRHWRIDKAAVNTYEQAVRPDERLLVLPYGIAFSPDDKKALIRMQLSYLYTHSPEEAEAVSRTFTPRWYAVQTKDGRVVREHRTENVPVEWW